ncbi:Peptide ABC transporter permease [Hyphomicrobiales bacterium]|nr:Peptide ABC transporter permease [Hyphomicrobiales bacterium]CAH1691303.1 Peptide ABC transporter permease [Hyphomicrobiales bacterium]
MKQRLPLVPSCLLAVVVLIALAAPLLPLSDPTAMAIARRLSPPSLQHLLGQDEYGRDVLSRLIWGARASLAIAFAASLIAGAIGTVLGIAGGFLRGWLETTSMRFVDVVLCFPPMLLALLAVTLLGPGPLTLIPVLALVFVPGFTRVAHAGVLAVRSAEYVEAMRVAGAGKGWIMVNTVLPNIAGPLLVQFSLVLASAVVLESGLSFLGLGVVPPTPSWGLMIGAARANMIREPLLLLWPCVALTATILIMNSICDGLRDAFDPRPLPHAARRLQRRMAGFPARGRNEKPPVADPNEVLAVSGLSVEIPTDSGSIAPVRDVSFTLRKGETLALVGESGSGKSVTSLAIMGLLPPQAAITKGNVRLNGQDIPHSLEKAMRKLRGRDVAMVFQDPGHSLHPLHTIGAQIAEAIRSHRAVGRAQARSEAIELLKHVGIPDPARRARAYPHELSGGMRQRVMIAMAVANRPALLIADEPTTALDVTVQAQVLELLAQLKREHGLAMLFITHSLPVVAEIADRVAVMYRGEIVEMGTVAEVFDNPLHPYTQALRRAVPGEDGLVSGPDTAETSSFGEGMPTRPAIPGEPTEPLVEVSPGRFVRGRQREAHCD